MRAFRTLMFAAMVLATTACASNAIKDQAASPAVEVPPTSATVAVSQPNVPPASAMPPYQDAASTTGIAAEAGDAAAAEDPNQAELDAEDIYAQKLVPDPWEGFNRSMFEQFARRFDFGPEPDSIAYLMRHGAKVSEMQVQMRERQAGESYFNAWKSIVYMARTCTSILFVQWFR